MLQSGFHRRLLVSPFSCSRVSSFHFSVFQSCTAMHTAPFPIATEWTQQFDLILTACEFLNTFFAGSLVSHEPSLTERTYAEALTLAAACWGSAQCDGCRRSVLTSRVEQGQRFRQREGLKERSAVGDTVEGSIYRAQWTEGFSRISYRGWERSASAVGYEVAPFVSLAYKLGPAVPTAAVPNLSFFFSKIKHHSV